MHPSTQRETTDTYTREALANRTNQIDFLITLENGLTYEKTFVFDLDANYETVVYHESSERASSGILPDSHR